MYNSRQQAHTPGERRREDGEGIAIPARLFLSPQLQKSENQQKNMNGSLAGKKDVSQQNEHIYRKNAGAVAVPAAY